MALAKAKKYSNWTAEEDDILKKVIFERINKGDTLVKAFEEVSSVTGRTAASVAFRWNNKLKKESLGEVKKIKRSLKKSKSKDIAIDNVSLDKKDHNESESEVDFTTVINFIKNLEEISEQNYILTAENNELKSKIDKLTNKLNGISKIVL